MTGTDTDENGTETNDDLRRYIAGEVGFRPPVERFSKYHLNSIHAYITGEFIERPSWVNLEFAPSSREFRQAVVRAINATFTGHDLPDDYNELKKMAAERDLDVGPSPSRDELKTAIAGDKGELFISYDPGDESTYPYGKTFGKDQLKAIRRAIDLSEDKRPSPNDQHD